ncbi:aldose epimerase family protein [Algoriphagus sp.]|uniref:aldose epimerase family protein n=1 Tax=Algoriphagus sp. TaxID=1872435 RepID=UPI0025D937DD|nr:aldose epimerase family protein [Algoriphagus sp.]
MKLILKSKWTLAVFTLFLACQNKPTEQQAMEETKQINFEFKAEKVGNWEGKDVFRYSLDNGFMQVEMTNFGGIISRIMVPDKDGNLENVVLALDSIPQYFTGNGPYLGAAVGRYANRISNASFELDGVKYDITKNIGENHLHGGKKGFGVKVWDQAEAYDSDNAIGVKMHYLSVDGEEGYPGNLDTWLYMELTSDNEIKVRFESTTDKKTIVNLTNHSYFNLGGINRDVKDHEVQIFADAYTAMNEQLITTGEVVDVEGTPFDFRTPKILGEQMDAIGGGFDHNFVTKRENTPDLKKIAKVKHPESGRVMEVYSTAPGVQFYNANGMRDFKGADGKVYQPFWAFCLEPQAWPDSPNKENFPSAALAPDEKYVHEIVFEFSVE